MPLKKLKHKKAVKVATGTTNSQGNFFNCLEILQSNDSKNS